jgi:hypothetical protein
MSTKNSNDTIGKITASGTGQTFSATFRYRGEVGTLKKYV